MKVYLSSTFADLQEYRNAVRNVLLRMGLEVSGLEDFGASESSALEKSLDEIAKADLFILLLAYRYGYIPPNSDKSIIELEYKSAKEHGIPIFAFLPKEDYPWTPKFIDFGHYNGPVKSDTLNEQNRVECEPCENTIPTRSKPRWHSSS